MKFALDLFGLNAITWKMTVFLNNLITMKILSVVWILDYPNLLLLNFFGTPSGIGLIEVVLCDSFGMKALKLKWAKIWPFLLTSDSLGKNIRLLFWVISLQFWSSLWTVVVNDLSWKFGVFFIFLESLRYCTLCNWNIWPNLTGYCVPGIQLILVRVLKTVQILGIINPFDDVLGTHSYTGSHCFFGRAALLIEKIFAFIYFSFLWSPACWTVMHRD